jgi:hypothetical protein
LRELPGDPVDELPTDRDLAMEPGERLPNERFPTAEEANTWCDTNRFAPQDCFAKKLSHTGVVEGSTRYRT